MLPPLNISDVLPLSKGISPLSCHEAYRTPYGQWPRWYSRDSPSGRHVSVHNCTRAGNSAGANLHRRDQQAIAADERPLPDLRPVFRNAIEVARHRPRADVRARADDGIPDVTEMANVGPRADAALLDLRVRTHECAVFQDAS